MWTCFFFFLHCNSYTVVCKCSCGLPAFSPLVGVDTAVMGCRSTPGSDDCPEIGVTKYLVYRAPVVFPIYHNKPGVLLSVAKLFSLARQNYLEKGKIIAFTSVPSPARYTSVLNLRPLFNDQYLIGPIISKVYQNLMYAIQSLTWKCCLLWPKS